DIDNPGGPEARAQTERLNRELEPEIETVRNTDAAEAGKLQGRFKPDGVEDVVEGWNFVRNMRSVPQPQRLASWLKAFGGVKDDGGDVLQQLGGTGRSRPGLINKNGSTLDDATLRAWEAGFFDKAERPTIQDFLDLLDEDLNGKPVVRIADREIADQLAEAEGVRRHLDRLGVSGARTEDELRRLLSQSAGTDRSGAGGREGADTRGPGKGAEGAADDQAPAGRTEEGAGRPGEEPKPTVREQPRAAEEGRGGEPRDAEAELAPAKRDEPPIAVGKRAEEGAAPQKAEPDGARATERKPVAEAPPVKPEPAPAAAAKPDEGGSTALNVVNEVQAAIDEAMRVRRDATGRTLDTLITDYGEDLMLARRLGQVRDLAKYIDELDAARPDILGDVEMSDIAAIIGAKSDAATRSEAFKAIKEWAQIKDAIQPQLAQDLKTFVDKWETLDASGEKLARSAFARQFGVGLTFGDRIKRSIARFGDAIQRRMDETTARNAAARKKARERNEGGRAAVDLGDTIARRAFDFQVGTGRPATVRPEVVAAGREALAEMEDLLPTGARMGVLTRVEPAEDDQVKLFVTTPSGQVFSLIGAWSRYRAQRGTVAPDGSIVLFRFDLGGNFRKSLQGDALHEIAHVVFPKALNDIQRTALVDHAASLRVMDMPWNEFAQKIGREDLIGKRGTITLRTLYERLYGGSPNRNALVAEEGATHMVELAHHGALTPEQLAPIADILDKIFTPQRGERAAGKPQGKPAATPQRRAFDELGFYSQALEAAKGLKQAKGTPEQMRAQLRKAGVKEAEIAATKLDEFLASAGKSVTQAAIVKHLEENRVTVQETAYGRGRSGLSEEETLARLEDISSERQRIENRVGPALEDASPEDMARLDALDAETAALRGNTKWASYSIDKRNPTYRETVLHLPPDKRLEAVRQRLDEILEQKNAILDISDRNRRKASDNEDYRRLGAEQSRLVAERDRLSGSNFRSGHWDEPNVVAHVRSSLQKDASGRPVFVLDELQSDWGQKIREGGTRDEAKIAELRQRIGALREEAADRQEAVMEASLSLDHLGFYRAGQALSAIRRSDWRSRFDVRPEDEPAAAVMERFAGLQTEIRRIEAELTTAEAPAPGHPLVGTTDQWVATALRRVVRSAAEAGADKIAIVPGKVQSRRFDIVQHVDGLRYAEGGGDLWAKQNGEWSRLQSGVKRSDLPQHIGKEMSDALLQTERGADGIYTIDNLKSVEIGGSGMKATYDQIYPQPNVRRQRLPRLPA
ncbi:MAG: hypothetical protein ACREC6_05060, partial [Hyphomicrobiaceae bacterium]